MCVYLQKKKNNRDRANTANPPVSGRQNNPVRMKPRKKDRHNCPVYPDIYFLFRNIRHSGFGNRH